LREANPTKQLETPEREGQGTNRKEG
jgi:hypothetical protein